MARHAAVDLALVFKLKAPKEVPERLAAPTLQKLRVLLCGEGLEMHDEPGRALARQGIAGNV